MRIDVDSGSEAGTVTGTHSDDDEMISKHLWDAVWIHPRQVETPPPPSLPQPRSTYHLEIPHMFPA